MCNHHKLPLYYELILHFEVELQSVLNNERTDLCLQRLTLMTLAHHHSFLQVLSYSLSIASFCRYFHFYTSFTTYSLPTIQLNPIFHYNINFRIHLLIRIHFNENYFIIPKKNEN